MEVITKSSLGKNINREMEMKNYLYLTWLEIWAFTFGNNDLLSFRSNVGRSR